MANKRASYGILVIVLVFGITIVGCNIGTPNNLFEGISWKMDDESTLYFYNSTWEWYNHWMSDVNDVLKQWDFKGSYTFKGNTATLIATHYRTEGSDWISWSGEWIATRTGNGGTVRYNGWANSKMVQNQSIENRGYGIMK